MPDYSMWLEYTDGPAHLLRSGYQDKEELMGFVKLYEDQDMMVSVRNEVTGEAVYTTW